MKRLIVVMAAVAVLLAAVFAASGQAAHHRTYAPKDCVKPRVEPSRIVLACGDFGVYLGHIDWNGWGHRRAHGKGRLYVNTCDPSCSAGNFKRYPVRVHLRKVRRRTCGGLSVPLFRKAILRFPGKRPSHAHRFHKNTLFCQP
jgi:hypothetical protein